MGFCFTEVPVAMVIEQSDGYMMAYQNSPWIEAAWESEAAKDGKSVCRDVNDILDKYSVGMFIGGNAYIPLFNNGIKVVDHKLTNTYKQIKSKITFTIFVKSKPKDKIRACIMHLLQPCAFMNLRCCCLLCNLFHR